MSELALMRSATRSKAVFDLWAARGADALVWDAGGRSYIDMLCALGAISLGARLIGAEGGVFSLPHDLERVAAEQVLRHVAPWATAVRFVKTGSEATEAAYRIAKKATGRTRVLIGDWAYHGQFMWCSDPEFPWALRYPHGCEFFAEDGHDIAAVFVEPHRWEPVSVEWLRSVRAFCDQIGALLVFDSMIYGGRMALGGASEYFGVIPDLECFGKALGNGQAIAFVVGKEPLAEHGEMISGTFSGDIVGLAALLETLQIYYLQPVLETLWLRGKQLKRGMDTLVGLYPKVFTGRSGAPVHQRFDFVTPEMGLSFMREMLNRGILWHPACTNVCYAHTEAQIERVIVAAEESAACLSH